MPKVPKIYLTLLLTTCTKAWWFGVVCRSSEKLIDNFSPPPSTVGISGIFYF
jgi:hypothetical protein